MFGILRSIKTRLGWKSMANLIASRPHVAEIVRKPCSSRIHSSSFRHSELSSTTKIKAFLSMITNPPDYQDFKSKALFLLVGNLTQPVLKPEKEHNAHRKMVVFYLCGNCDFKSLRRTR